MKMNSKRYETQNSERLGEKLPANVRNEYVLLCAWRTYVCLYGKALAAAAGAGGVRVDELEAFAV